MPVPIDNDIIVTIRAMRTGGFTEHQIKDALGLSLSTVSKYCFTINEEREHKRAYSRSRSRNDAPGQTQPRGDSA